MAIALVVIGAVNWGVVGLFGFDVIAGLFGRLSALSRIIYVIVGLAGLYLLYAAVQLGKRERVTTMP
ncbi:DUF378 domain-containing protein [Sorangium sp. So ce381]|uniref:DUF378 domain-containing protein n=1 Tax=Sorangium sp. So ce381 TaxID=3133307 RepID=UPI003F5B38E4